MEVEEVVIPGFALRCLLESKGMSQAELSRRMGRPAKTVNEIVQGKTRITATTAVQLEYCLGRRAGYWLELESTYRLALARKKVENGKDS